MAFDPSLLKGKTGTQKKVIKYFLGSGCINALFGMKDEAYSEIVRSMAEGNGLKQTALKKLGIDEDQVKEIPPVYFEGYVFDKAYAKRGNDGIWRSSKYQMTWLFFSSDQVYIHSYTFNTDEDSKSSKSEEYFYKDVTNFSSSSDTTETRPDASGKKRTVESHLFSMVVPGEKFTCSMQGTQENEAVIQAMKQKLREKKQ